MSLGVRLGVRDLFHEKGMSAVLVLALAAALTPILIIYALKNGVIEALLDDLRSDPATRAIIFQGDQMITPEQIDIIKSWQETGFMAPAHRSLAARTVLRPASRQGVGGERAILFPTAAGDPLLERNVDTVDGQIVLSQRLASALGVVAGDRVIARNARRGESGAVIWDRPFDVIAVLPSARLAGARALMDVSDLSALEAFLDGFETPDGEVEGRALSDRETVYESARLYAVNIDAVASLVAQLEHMGFIVSSRSGDVERVRKLEANFNRVFVALALVSAAGGLAMLSAALAANARAKRKVLCVARLIGTKRVDLVLFCTAQGLVAAVAGFVLAVGSALIGVLALNQVFAEAAGGASIALLGPADVMTALSISALGAVAASIYGAWTAARVSPAEALSQEG